MALELPQPPPAPKQAGYYDTNDTSQLLGPYEGAEAAHAAALLAGVPAERISIFRWSDADDMAQQFTPPPEP